MPTLTHIRGALALGIAAAVITAGIPAASAADILSATPSTIAGATLAVTPPTASSPPGVSPDVFFDDTTGTYYLYTTNMPTKTYTSTDGTNWTEAAGAKLPQGFDWSVVKLGPNDYRMYYAAIMPNSPAVVKCTNMKKALFYATSTDLLHWTPQPGPLLDDVGCGVPHALRKPDGTYVLYYNTITTQHGIHIATSNDGLAWTTLSGLIANDPDLVDPAPLMMPDGTFLMVSSTTGGGRGAQELQILSSTNGIDWTHRSNALLAIPNVSVLDPSLKLINGQLRVWFGYAPGMDHNNSKIASGILTLGSAPAPTSAKPGSACSKAGAKAKFQGKAIVCKKITGKLIWARVG
ncbi:MAG: hypothetical protein F2793_08325 [Actinobacteria bacterium]|uniref:Unannotated protein n=1 Tax=freshwater metagenome TaxID=449393 RepID=A0A6J7EQY4_9ZZZZ|nr:hypothetical protein [Actinomycetota bacterium]